MIMFEESAGVSKFLPFSIFTSKVFAKSLSAALGFANRLEYYALIARDLTFLGVEIHSSYEAAIIEVKKMLNKFVGQLRHE